jgi:hypothetical protein
MSKLAARLLEELGGLEALNRNSALSKSFRGRGVYQSTEFVRVRDLPRRTLLGLEDSDEADRLARAVSDFLFWAAGGRGPSPLPLRPLQAAMLVDCAEHRGMMVSLGVGFGKCATGDTEILDPTHGRRTLAEVSGGHHAVMTLRAGRAVGEVAACEAQGKKQCVRVTLASGEQLKVSRDHRIHTWHGWVPAGELSTTDLVAAARSYDLPASASRFSDEDVALTALLLADGGLTTSTPTYTKTDNVLRADCIRFATTLGMTSRETLTSKKAPYVSLRNSKSWRERVGLFFGLSKHKRVPPSFWLLPEKQCALFLNYFLAGDGYVEPSGIMCVLASYGLLKDLRVMLLRLGIRCSVRPKPSKCKGVVFDAWRLSITGDDARRFLDVVGDLRGLKAERCRALRDRLASKKPNSNWDVVGVSVPEANVIADDLALPRSSVRRKLKATKGQRVGRTAFLRFCDVFRYSGRHAQLAKLPVRWERVEAVEFIGEQETFDVCVPGTETFFAENMHVHNSWVAALFAVEPGSVPKELRDRLDGMWPQVECERPVLLLPPSVRDEMERDVIPNLARVYRIHPNLKLVSYSELQTARRAGILNELRPDFLCCDEVDSLKNVGSARTKRVKHWLKNNPQTVFAGMTATPADRSLRDLHHLVMWSHPLDPPLPRGWKELQDWANAVDADVPELERLAPGALLGLCAPGESAREGLARRMAETSGFVLASEPSCSVPLWLIARRDVELPRNVTDALAMLDSAWMTPDNEPVPDAARWAAHSRTLALGFYYRWDWSKITRDGKPDFEWLEAKRDWGKAVAEVCRRGLPEFDSELRVRNAARRRELPKSLQEPTLRALEHWDTQSQKPEPPTVPVWLSDVVMHWVLRWMRDNVSGIVWVEHSAVQQWFARNFDPERVYAAGMNEELRQLARGPSAGKYSIVCSRGAHFRGKNLQAWSRSLVLTPGPNAKIWEQLLGRTHRSGQKAPEVRCDFLVHTQVSFRSMAAAIKRAHFLKEQMRMPQKLLDCVAEGWNKSEQFPRDALDAGFDS